MGEEVKEKKPNKYVEGFKGFCTFLYNPDDHTVFGRGGASWGKILIFYFFFYSCLAGFFAVCLTVMLTTIDPDVPTVVGRSNKPMVAAFDTRLYKINFGDESEFASYKEGIKALKGTYDGNKGFAWGVDTLGECWQDVSTRANASMKACIYVGLNRIYGWEAPNTETSKLSFECNWDKGKTGSGNTDPPFTMTMSSSVRTTSEAAIEAYYPWTSMEKNGRQPMQAFLIKQDTDKMEAAQLNDDHKMDTYVVCNAVMRNTVDGSTTKVEGSRPAEFEIKYTL